MASERGNKMIVYCKLAEILEERNMKWKDLCDAGLSVNMPARFSQNKSVNTDTIDKVCAFLKVQPGDIMEWVESEDSVKERELQAKIAAMQKELDALKAKK